jgi:hypothetical protein
VQEESRRYQQLEGEASPRARLKQPSPSRYLSEEMVRYDDYEQPQAHYPGQRQRGS